MSRTARTVTASVAAVAFVATAAWGSIALAQDGQDTAADAAQQQSQQDGVTWDQQADGTADKTVDQLQRENGGSAAADSDAAASDAGADASADSAAAADAARPVERDPANLPAAVAAGCDAVADWATLNTCLQTTGVVTISNTIDAAGNAPITIPAGVDVVLTAATGVDPALTSTAAGDGVLIVNGSLTIGKDKDDAGFSYKDGKRWLALVNNGGSLTINNGTFSGVDTRGTSYANGGVVAVAAGAKATVINSGTFSDNKATRGAVIYSDSGNGIAIHGGTFDGNSSDLAAGVIMQASTSATMTIDAASGTVPKFTNNSSINSQGGAIHNKGALTINAGEFTGNKAKTNGGVISQDAAGSVTIHGGTFSNNSATGNGGVIQQGAAGGSITVSPVNGRTVKFDGNTSGKQGAVFYTVGDLTIDDGEFTNNVAKDNGGVIQQPSGKIVIQKGTFKGNKAARGSVIYSNSATSIAIHGGIFDSNASTMAAGAIMNNSEGNNSASTLTIDATSGTVPEFTNNTAGTQGGAIHNNGTLTINAGKFEGNKALGDGGGAISQNAIAAKTTITGGVTFTGNAQDLGTADKPCTGLKGDPCQKGTSGGGAIRTTAGTLTLEGDVKFEQNYANAWNWMAGGGAIYAQGTLWLKSDPQDSTKVPQFTKNWATIADTYGDNSPTIPNGSAGGAIFLQSSDSGRNVTSTAYILAGKFEDNISGYLGGAVYTEESSTTYVANAVAHDNTAGHFGGGLWLCPSGVGTASKGGNIALFDNKTAPAIDRNNTADTNGNATPRKLDGSKVVDANKDGYQNQAGADFAIMNPWSKNMDGIDHNSFQLMDTWFTSRTEKAVDWSWDGQPLQEASGFADWYQNNADTTNQAAKGWGTSSQVTAKSGVTNKMDVDQTTHTKDLNLGYNGDVTKNGVTTKLTCTASETTSSATYCDMGIALKATPVDDTVKSVAISKALVSFTGNKARLSGGAFATNGNVNFSTPYEASWTKVDADDTAKLLGGSSWKLSTKDGGAYSSAMEPTVCSSKAATLPDYCWPDAAGADGTKSIVVRDDDNTDKDYEGLDNSPTAGEFSINNLAPGTYTLTELTAPDAHWLSKKAYTFSVTDGQPTIPVLSELAAGGTVGAKTDANKLPNEPTAVTWHKVSTQAAADTTKYLKGAQWQLVRTYTVNKKDANGNDIIGSDGKPETEKATTTYCVVDGNADGISKPAPTATDPNATALVCPKPAAEGEKQPDVIRLTDMSKTDDKGAVVNEADGTIALRALPFGEYTLTETASPDGYDMPAEGTNYTFAISQDQPVDQQGNAIDVAVSGAFDKDGKELKDATMKVKDGNRIPNKPGVTLPATGGPGVAGITAAGMFAVTVAMGGLALTFARRARR